MRIDFSQIDQEDGQPTSSNTSFSSTIPQIWKHAFIKDKKIPNVVAEQEQQSMSFSVNYPFEIARSVSPSAISKQLSYLQAKKILPTSTLRFIQNTLHAQLERQIQTERINSQEKSSSKQSQQQTNQPNDANPSKLDLVKKLERVRADQNTNDLAKTKRKRYEKIKPRVYDIKKEMRSEKSRAQENLDNVTLKPILNYTMNSKIAKQVQRQRNHRFKTYNTNVFETLYYDAAVYSTKRQMRKMSIQEEESLVMTRSTSRIKIYSTFQERLQCSIEKDSQRKKQAQNKLSFDLSTGQKLFVPDTTRSKITYATHFRCHSPLLQSGSRANKTLRYSKDSAQYRKSIEKTTTFNDSFQKGLNNSLDKYKITKKFLSRDNKLAELYANLLWREDQLTEDALSKQQKQILSLFLQEIKAHLRAYSKNISRQVFIAFFKEVYAIMNLFDRQILNKRLKKERQQLNQKSFKVHDQQLTDKRHEKALISTRNITYRQKDSFQPRLDHTSKHFFI